jgi:hypothetical protein
LSDGFDIAFGEADLGKRRRLPVIVSVTSIDTGR